MNPTKPISILGQPPVSEMRPKASFKSRLQRAKSCPIVPSVTGTDQCGSLSDRQISIINPSSSDITLPSSPDTNSPSTSDIKPPSASEPTTGEKVKKTDKLLSMLFKAGLVVLCMGFTSLGIGIGLSLPTLITIAAPMVIIGVFSTLVGVLLWHLKNNSTIFSGDSSSLFSNCWNFVSSLVSSDVTKQEIKDHGVTGIKNSTYTNCWLNSLLQVLINSGLNEKLQKEPIRKDGINDEGYARQLQLHKKCKAFVEKYKDVCETPNKSNPDPVNLRKALFNDNRQQDADEALRKILELDSNEENIIQTQEILQSGDGYQNDNRIEKNVPILMIDFEEGKENVDNLKLIDLLKYYHDKKCHAEVTQDGRSVIYTRQQQKILSFPKDLFLYLRRTRARVLDSGCLEAYKEKAHVEAPLDVDMGEIFNENKDKQEYQLKGFACHLGSSLNGGHYTSYVKKNDTWFRCNDSNVTEIDEGDALKAAKDAYVLHYEKVDQPQN